METVVFAAIFILALVALSLAANLFAIVTVYEYQRAVFYRDGSVSRVLGAGTHRYLKRRASVQIVDMRRTMLTLPGQEILTKDNVNLKLSVAGAYEICDPVRALHGSQHYLMELYSVAQIALRDAVGLLALDDLLEKRAELDAKLLAGVSEGAAVLGLTVTALSVKDIMLPANLKRAYSAVLEARKEAQRQLEQARGEQAVLRSLANAASLYEGSPTLLQARVIQALAAGNNSIVFGADGTLAPRDKKP